MQPPTQSVSRPARQSIITGQPITHRRKPVGQLAALLTSAVFLLVLWHVLVSAAQLPSWLLPRPLLVLARLRAAWVDGTLVQHVVPTLMESLGGFALALLVGSLAGYGVAYSRQMERWLAPYIAAAQAIPVIAIAPLVIIWFGRNTDVLRNTVIAAIVVVFPIFSSTLTGVRTIPRELREVGLVEGATRWQRLRFIDLPLALPVVFSGMRTSLAYATTGAVVGEFVGSRYGLGALINIARGLFDTPLIFVALVCLGAITLLLYLLLAGMEHVALRWLE
jgi:NitT/TauT family transport system permease protein